MKSLYLFFILVIFLRPVESFGWGREGHHMVAEIAQSQMSQNILDSVQFYLGTLSLDDASTWMDDVRGDHAFDYMKTWHYIDIEKGESYNPSKDSEPNCVNQIQRVIKELNAKSTLSKEQISLDVKVLFHLAGDIGMPLHCGYPEDKGGNTIQVDFMGKKSNLHRVWDTDIIVYRQITTQLCKTRGSQLTSQDLLSVKTMDVIAWMNDSRKYLPDVYGFTDNLIDENYVDKNVPIIERQIFISGSRLANVLTQVFSK